MIVLAVALGTAGLLVGFFFDVGRASRPATETEPTSSTFEPSGDVQPSFRTEQRRQPEPSPVEPPRQVEPAGETESPPEVKSRRKTEPRRKAGMRRKVESPPPPEPESPLDRWLAAPTPQAPASVPAASEVPVAPGAPAMAADTWTAAPTPSPTVAAQAAPAPTAGPQPRASVATEPEPLWQTPVGTAPAPVLAGVPAATEPLWLTSDVAVSAPAPAPTSAPASAAAAAPTALLTPVFVEPVVEPVAAPVAPPPPPMPAPSAPAAKTRRPPVTTAPDLERGPALLVCRGVHVAYDKVRVLFGVDVELARGEIVALLGTNGAGKSTLLKAISGLVDPVEGTILFDGQDITHMDPVERAKLGIVQVPGGKAVFPTLTVAEHFKAAAWLYAKEDAAEIRQRTDRVLELFPRLRERWHQMAGNLSGGEQQQLGLGMAFVAHPSLLIIDELSLGLAPSVVEQLLDIVRAIHAEGATVILVEQSVNVALTIAQRAYFMEKGEVRFEGPADELLQRGDILRSVFLQGAAGTTEHGAMPGAAPAVAVRSEPVPGAGDSSPLDRPVALHVRGLTKRFGGITAVEDVTFDLHQGETLGLIGPNGAGKTTILDLISGMIPLDGGGIVLHGVEISGWSAARRASAGLGRSFQDARIFPSLTVRENLAIGLDRHVETRDHLAALLDLPAIQTSERDVATRVEELVELMSLEAYRDKFVSELSTGVRRMVDLAMVIGHEPSVLLLDEPSSGIAQRETEALGPLLKRIQEDLGCSILVIEHDMPLITAVSDEVIALDLGSVVIQGTAEEVLSDPEVVSSYLGGDIDVIHRSGTRPVTSAF